MKIINKICFLGFIAFCILFNTDVYAATNTINVKSSSSVTIGNSINVTVTVSSSEALGAWDFNISYDSSKLALTSNSSLHVVGYGDGNITSKSYTYTFKTKQIGSAKVWVDSATYATFADSDNYASITKGSKTINVIEKKIPVVVSYSKDNYLSSLSIKDYEFEPTFKKDVLEYSIMLEENTKTINIMGKLSDSKASVKGLGDIILTDGENNIEISVTAENGNVRIYKIKAIVKEPDPIIIDIDGKNYTVVRKSDGINVPSNYKETTATINGTEVLAYYGEVTKYNLLALKDSEGNINLYIYDLNNNSYTLYRELKFNFLNIYPLNIKDIKENYELSKITINGIEVDCLKRKSFYPIIYGMNLETGEIDFYSYDAKENTLQRYNDESENYSDKQLKLYYYLIIGISSFAVFELLMIIIILICKTKKATKELNNTLAHTMKLNELEIKEYKEKLNKKNKKEIKKQLKEQKKKEKLNKKNKNKDMEEL